MAKAEDNYQVVYRNETLSRFVPGGWVFFQRPKENGGGYWLGRTFDGVFLFEFSKPVSLFQGLVYLRELENKNSLNQPTDDDFFLS
ncbi:hypothetical protein Q3V30_04230 [Erwinia pyri]|uniref:LF-82 n=1 Tax=Erwinia pyri TaxID=3062598 RepID=A0AA50DMN3_9GAMM|nr:hypothetical protein [Erwinia sp. DE2]WLS79723.1 hypothetical protein Q3V30_04230 [Erwinia sp. DE2]